MSIAAGAMGGIYGGWLQQSGNDVVLVDVSKDSVRAINEAGLSIDERDGRQSHIRVRASDDPKSVGQVDLIINFVKCYHTEVAINAAKTMLGSETAVLTLQNGWGNADQISGIVGRDRVLVGLTYHSGTVLGPGRVKHPGVGMTYVGELDGRETPRLQRIAAGLRGAGFEIGAQRLHAADCRSVGVLRPRIGALRRHERSDGGDLARGRGRRQSAGGWPRL